MSDILFIFLGSGLGGLMRYWVSTSAFWTLGRKFPYGTLFVNISGCFLMGLFFIIIVERFSGHSHYLRPLLLIGFLGGYTTFSAFSLETINLLETGSTFSGYLYILLSVILCLFATALGVWVAKQ